MTVPERLRVAPGGALRGAMAPPGDKSVSHRAVMLGAIATGTTRVLRYLDSEDVRATLGALRAMGVEVAVTADALEIRGRGSRRLETPRGPLDMGNSGTAMRLLAGLLAGQGVAATLIGDASLSRRPMARIIEPLRLMGARIDGSDGRPPLVIGPGATLTGIHYRMPLASAQVKSALLLAGLGARGVTCVSEPQVTRDHTERMLRQFGVRVAGAQRRACLEGGQPLAGQVIEVPGDISSAAFFMVGASLAPGSEVLLRRVGVNPTRTGVIDILRLMGADIDLEYPRTLGTEPVADIRVRAAPLHGVEVPPSLVPLAIDEFPAIGIAAAGADGETHIGGAQELRVKESDRIAALAEVVNLLGGTARERPDGLLIRGGALRGGRVHSHGDHRIAMAAAMAALVCREPVVIDDCRNVATSFPGFVAAAAGLGLGIEDADG